jgi:hypothetical protein
MFDWEVRLDELRCHGTEWLRTHLDEVVAEQRALKVEELAVRRILDERGQVDVNEEILRGAHNEAPRTVRQTMEVARALETLPAIAAAAHAGEISWDQLVPLAEIATPETDAVWAERAPRYSPVELERIARRQKTPSAADAAARREARDWRFFSRPGTGMMSVRGELPDVDGVFAKAVFERMAERRKPAAGEPWEKLGHRMADAFIDLCKNYADGNPGPLRSHITFHVPPDGPAEVDGIPIADSTVADLMEHATVSTVTVGDGQMYGARTDTDDIPAETKRFVRARDYHCRVGNCDESDGLDYHHLIPRSEGGSHDPNNVVLACKRRRHHQMLVPNGPWRLEGDPSKPDGLRLVRVKQVARAP